MKSLACIGTVVGLLAAGVASGAEPRLVNGYAAIVNDRVITYHQVEAEVRPTDIEAAQMRYGRQPQALAQEIDRLRQDALLGLIESQLILHEFQTANYRLPESIIEEQLKDRVREDYGDQARLILSLRARGTTLDTFRRRIREDFIVSAMTARNVSSAVIISPYKIETYYRENEGRFQLPDRVHLRMIVVAKRADRGLEACREVADQALAQLKEGASFKDLAVRYSDDANRRPGGDWGWVERGQLREDLQAVAFGLKTGGHSEVLEKPEGCYLMFAEEYRAAHTQSLKDVRDEIEDVLRRSERARLRQDWIKRLRAKSFVRLFPLR